MLEQGQTARTLVEHELVKALNYRTDELDSARQGLCRTQPRTYIRIFSTCMCGHKVTWRIFAEVRQAHESAKAAMVEITMLQSELGLARKHNNSLQVSILEGKVRQKSNTLLSVLFTYTNIGLFSCLQVSVYTSGIGGGRGGKRWDRERKGESLIRHCTSIPAGHRGAA